MNFSNNEFITTSKRYAASGSIVLKSMANHHRLLILCCLKEREYSVGELEDIVGLSQSALSQHLARLRKDEMVETRRSAQTIYYSLPQNQARKILDSMCSIFADTQNEQGSAPMSTC
tara:strand:+ start:6207 stop:6557 length:351 start_codon:yes stop_codon:yes gene_type:complete